MHPFEFVLIWQNIGYTHMRKLLVCCVRYYHRLLCTLYKCPQTTARGDTCLFNSTALTITYSKRLKMIGTFFIRICIKKLHLMNWGTSPRFVLSCQVRNPVTQINMSRRSSGLYIKYYFYVVIYTSSELSVCTSFVMLLS